MAKWELVGHNLRRDGWHCGTLLPWDIRRAKEGHQEGPERQQLRARIVALLNAAEPGGCLHTLTELCEDSGRYPINARDVRSIIGEREEEDEITGKLED